MPAMLMMGSRGDDTKLLQSKLNRLVTPGPDLDVDGIFGPLTDQAVRRFQSQRGILVDGIVGPQTWSEINRLAPGGGSTGGGNTGGGSGSPGGRPGSGGSRAAVEPTYQVALRARDIAFWERGVMEQPLGSNSGPKVDQYLASCGLPPGNLWCMAFVYWCYRAAAFDLNQTNPAYRNASCTQVHTWAVNNNKIVTEPQDGDIFLVPKSDGTGYSHTGIVVRAGQSQVSTIEGNTNDNGSSNGIGVYYRVRSRSGLSFVRLADLNDDVQWPNL